MNKLEFSQKPLFNLDTEYRKPNQSFNFLDLYKIDISNTNLENSTSIILAGGSARRFENKNKALLTLSDKSFISHISENLLNFDKFYLSVSQTHEFNKAEYNLIIDKFIDKGPVGAIVSSLKEISEEYIFFIPCDMPLINQDLPYQFIKTLKKTNADAIIPCDSNGKIHPLCCALNKRALPIFEAELNSNNLRLLKIFQKLNTHIIQIEDKYLININTQNDLSLAKKLINE